ncbi:MAG: tetratricopeptide repeat protein [Pseudomonadota bacterium]
MARFDQSFLGVWGIDTFHAPRYRQGCVALDISPIGGPIAVVDPKPVLRHIAICFSLTVVALPGAAPAQSQTVAPASQTEANVPTEEEALAAERACVDLAGPPTASVPVSAEAQAARLDGLRAARADCTRAAELNPEAGDALFHLGTIAQARGRHREAVDLFERSAAAGVVPASVQLGDYYNFGIGPIRADTDRAVAHYTAAAEAGDLAGITTLGFMHRLGRGVPRSTARMVDLFQEAADQGYHFAQMQLAQTYLTGEGVPGNSDVALGIPDPARALPLFEASAAQGNLQAALGLSQIYATGADGITPDPAAQFRWTDMAAEAGFPAAIAARAYLMEQGIGVTRNPDQAAAEYIRALETGEVRAADLRAVGGRDAPRWDDTTARAFQVILQERGLYAGPIDGLVGGGTLRAADRVDG